MDCLLTFNLSCVNGTLIQLSSSSIIFGDVLHPNLLVPVDSFNNESHRSTSQSISSRPILVSLQHCIITAIILGGIILSTITGNILVIVAVIREKTLHSVAYYLFVSLAVADLMVASMVSDCEEEPKESKVRLNSKLLSMNTHAHMCSADC